MIPMLLRVMERSGYAVFTEGEYNLNLIAQRTRAGRSRGEMPDLFSVIYRERGGWTERAFPCSTTPGWSALQAPRIEDGVAVLQPGQFRRAYRRGLHKGRPALVQHRAVRIRRDKDRDTVIDPASVVYDGWFGINIHDDVGIGSEASEGCPVMARESLSEVLALCQLAELRWGLDFTLTLVEV